MINIDKIIYTSQLILNETLLLENTSDDTKFVFSKLSHAPIIAGTVSGKIYNNELLIASFVVDENGVFAIESKIDSFTLASDFLNLKTGELVIDWTVGFLSGANRIVINYEYMESDDFRKWNGSDKELPFYVLYPQLKPQGTRSTN